MMFFRTRSILRFVSSSNLLKCIFKIYYLCFYIKISLFQDFQNIFYKILMSNRQQQTQYGYLSHRPTSPKLTPNNQSSPTNHHNLSSNLGQSSKTQVQSEQITLIHKENSVLRQENQALWRQLIFIRKQGLNPNTNGHQQSSKQINDLRETIKKQAGEIKELKVRLEVLSKQCKMYEQIIDKMEGKINKLSESNKILQEKNKLLLESKQKQGKSEKAQNQKLEMLKEKVSDIMSKYKQLQGIVYTHQMEQSTYKQQWNRQKTYYLNRIKDLQILMGIGSQTKDYDRKRY